MLYERHDDSFEATLATMVRNCYYFIVLLLLLFDPQRRQARRASERLLRIIEKVGILFAFTFNMTHSESQNETFNGSHIGKCFQLSIVSALKCYRILIQFTIVLSSIYTDRVISLKIPPPLSNSCNTACHVSIYCCCMSHL